MRTYRLPSPVRNGTQDLPQWVLLVCLNALVKGGSLSKAAACRAYMEAGYPPDLEPEESVGD